MRALRTWTAVLTMAGAVACGGDKVAGPGSSAAGTWTGVTDATTLTLVLSDVAGEVHGSGTIAQAGGAPTAFTVLDGQWAETSAGHSMVLSLTSSSGSAPVTFSCTTASASECDGPARFQNGNAIYFTIAR